jgi:hypothetical protein
MIGGRGPLRFVLVLGVLAVLPGALFDPIASMVIRNKMVRALAKSCPACQLRMGRITTHLWPARLTFENLVYTGDPGDSTVFDFSAEKISLEFKLHSLISFMSDAPDLKRVEVFRPRVLVSEVDGGPPGQRPAFPPPGYALKGFPAIRVGGVFLHDGTLTYELKVRGKPADINVYDINGETNEFVTRAALLQKDDRHDLKMDATGRLEKSGSVHLKVAFDPFAEKNEDTIELEVDGQNMAELNPFFDREDGLDFKGVLEHTHAKLSLSQGRLIGLLRASYKDLDFDYRPTPDRAPIPTFLQNTIQSAMTAKTRPKEGEDNPPQAIVQAERLPREPITKLLIRGLKDAAKKILAS